VERKDGEDVSNAKAERIGHGYERNFNILDCPVSASKVDGAYGFAAKCCFIEESRNLIW
jgi:hypothetical protein